MLKKKEHFSNSYIFETSLGIALRAYNKFKCFQILFTGNILNFGSSCKVYFLFRNSKKVLGSNIQWISWVIMPIGNSWAVTWDICLEFFLTLSLIGIGAFDLNPLCFGCFTSENEDGNIWSAVLTGYLLKYMGTCLCAHSLISQHYLQILPLKCFKMYTFSVSPCDYLSVHCLSL